MLLGFFDLIFELCLPFIIIIAVFLELSSSSVPRYANLYHRCAVFLVSSFPFSSALLRFPESFMFFCIHNVCPGPSSSEHFCGKHFCLHHALKNPLCFPTTHKLFHDLTTCALLISLIILFHKTHSIPFLVQGLQPLDPFAC